MQRDERFILVHALPYQPAMLGQSSSLAGVQLPIGERMKAASGIVEPLGEHSPWASTAFSSIRRLGATNSSRTWRPADSRKPTMKI
jgi:hypothetical protein